MPPLHRLPPTLSCPIPGKDPAKLLPPPVPKELVSVAFTVATGTVEAMRPAGIVTLIDIVCKFGAAVDPDYEGHLLLEQYHAQIVAALRPCFAEDSEPSLAASGCALASRYTMVVASTADSHEVDPVSVRKLLSLLTKLVTDGLHQVSSFCAASRARLQSPPPCRPPFPPPTAWRFTCLLSSDQLPGFL